MDYGSPWRAVHLAIIIGNPFGGHGSIPPTSRPYRRAYDTGNSPGIRKVEKGTRTMKLNVECVEPI